MPPLRWGAGPNAVQHVGEGSLYIQATSCLPDGDVQYTASQEYYTASNYTIEKPLVFVVQICAWSGASNMCMVSCTWQARAWLNSSLTGAAGLA